MLNFLSLNNMKTNVLSLFIISLTLSGCATPASMGVAMPGEIKIYESKTDGTKHLEMEPGVIGDDYGAIKLGLHKSSDTPKDEAILIVATYMSAVDHKKGITINIDGERTSFTAIDALSNRGPYNYLYKRFPVKLSYIKKMIEGNQVWVKVSLISKTYTEGEFSKPGKMTAKPGFSKFLAEADRLFGATLSE